MTKDALVETFVAFFENAKDNPPDIKEIARLLRSGPSLPPGFCVTLAEILDSQLPERLACNWNLRPQFIGRQNSEFRRIQKETLVFEATSAVLNITAAINELGDRRIPGMSERTAWEVHKNIERQRERFYKLVDASADLNEEAKARIKQSWRP